MFILSAFVTILSLVSYGAWDEGDSDQTELHVVGCMCQELLVCITKIYIHICKKEFVCIVQFKCLLSFVVHTNTTY